MKDKNGIEIMVGSLIKRCGNVRFADGLKYKISKKTWQVSKIEDGTLYYLDENGNHTKLSLPKNEGAFLVVGDENGVSPEHAKPSFIDLGGGVAQKYRVHGNIEEKGWQDEDIVLIHGKVSQEMIDSGVLELVPDSVQHQHVLIVVDALKAFAKNN